MATTKKTNAANTVNVAIKPPDIRRLDFHIKGTAPYVQAR